MNFLVYFGIFSTPKLSECTMLFAFTYQLSNEFLLIHSHQDLLHMPNPLF